MYNWGLRTSVPRYDMARLSNVAGQILTEPPTSSLPGHNCEFCPPERRYLYQECETHSEAKQTSCPVLPTMRQSFIYLLFILRHCQNGNEASKCSMNVENSLEAVLMRSHPGKYIEGLRKIMQKYIKKSLCGGPDSR
jgi:hypothetical protein